MRRLPLVLIIEPEWPTRSYLRAELEERGYHVLAFETTEDARRALEQWGMTPSVIVIDCSRNGRVTEGSEELLARFAHTPLLVIASPLRAVPETLRHRAVALLERPLSVREIVAAIQRLLPSPFIER